MRKGITKVDSVAKMKLENATIWIKIVSATQTKVNSSKATGINKKVLEIIKRHRKLKVNDFIQLALFGKLGTEIYHEIKKISPTKRVEVEEIRVV